MNGTSLTILLEFAKKERKVLTLGNLSPYKFNQGLGDKLNAIDPQQIIIDYYNNVVHLSGSISNIVACDSLVLINSTEEYSEDKNVKQVNLSPTEFNLSVCAVLMISDEKIVIADTHFGMYIYFEYNDNWEVSMTDCLPDDKSSDYLLRGGIISKIAYQKGAIIDWNTMINDPATLPRLKLFFTKLAVPNNISLFKFTLNLNYIIDKLFINDYKSQQEGNDFYKSIAPSLRLLYRDENIIPREFPVEFNACFPDVVNSVIQEKKGESSLLSALYKNNTPEKLITNDGFFDMVHLDNIVHAYKYFVPKKQLECTELTL